ncbi:xanthine dehydrogenase molybdopterin binding subunit [Devosia sp.]|uniref:xanthine dehydrogenase molybdopterin binding subunit n=1 Tax=Devosia sp. TaxID=1871048 RepID=UPI002614DC6F|nr:xanthine dehydrogenase molybdopterin binding subunit [Devosia sp.]
MVPHDSAHKHVTGRAEYVDDIPEPTGTLHAYLGTAAIASGEITGIDVGAVLAAPGVVGVITAADIPGKNDISPAGIGDDTLFCETSVTYHGQPIFAVVGRTRDAARRAAKLAKISYAETVPILDVRAAQEAGGRVVAPGMVIQNGNVKAALEAAAHVVRGSITIGGQEHFYLEGQVSLVVPGEDGEVTLHTATQHPSDTQDVVARVLGLDANGVRVHVRRMGGGFGGKETQGTLFAAVGAVAARKFGRAIKVRPDRDDDMMITGKRHDYVVDYAVGFDDNGIIAGVEADYGARCGYSLDLSIGVTDRTLMHASNAYYFPATRVASQLYYTNTVSNTAFRGYGGPQGLVAVERMIEEIAYTLGLDTLEVRKRNFYDGAKRNATPYGQEVRDNIMPRIIAELEASSEYQARRAEIIAHNRTNPIVRRGIGMVPVKFGISFSKKVMNQGAVLLTIYRDGSVHVSQGGTEMGQGLHTKIMQVIAEELHIDLSRVRITATATDKVPNAAPTAGSLGTDLNGMAAIDATRQIKQRLVEFAMDAYRVHAEQVVFEHEAVRVGRHLIAWPEMIEQAYGARVSLSAAGFYKTPHISWDRKAGKGSPYLYFTYGAACSEVAVDTLTGEYVVLRTDILQDVGRSINRDIDIGQIEGGFIQGMGWLTTEELWWDSKGRLRTHAPSTYKIPVASDRPRIFNVALAEWSINEAPTVRNSKAVGEPPIMLAIAVLDALGMAVASVADYRKAPHLDTPATPERVLMAMERLRAEAV